MGVYIYTFDFIQVCMCLLYRVIVEEGKEARTRNKTIHTEIVVMKIM